MLTTEEKVKEFITSKLGVPIDKITLNAKIESDLGIAGLDTITFYEEFFEEFDIMNPEDFDLDRYVTSENLEIGIIIKSIFSVSEFKNIKAEDISIEHLIRVAETKYWIEEHKDFNRS